MKSRMDKYNIEVNNSVSRTKKNQELYDEVRNSSLEDFDLNSNVSVIDDNAEIIDVNKVKKLLDNRYNADMPRRKGIFVPESLDENKYDVNTDTKEYDINAFLSKAKQGKEIDYNKDRLRKVHEAQYEILNNLDLELKKVDDNPLYKKDKAAEENLMNLINTITQIEINNKNYNKETSQALELLSDLADPVEENANENFDTNTIITEEEIISNEQKEDIEDKDSAEDEVEKKNINKLRKNELYDEFYDIQSNDKGSIFLKIMIFILIIALVVGALYIVDYLLDLGIFNFLNK